MDMIKISIEAAKAMCIGLADKKHEERVKILEGCYSGDFEHWATMAAMVVLFSQSENSPDTNHTSIAVAAIEAAHAIGVRHGIAHAIQNPS